MVTNYKTTCFPLSFKAYVRAARAVTDARLGGRHNEFILKTMLD